MASLKLKYNFSAAIGNIYAHVAPMNRGLNWTYLMLKNRFQKYFRYARMTSLNISKFDFSAAISNIYAQFATVSRGRYCAYFTFQQHFESFSCMREWRH